MIEFGYTKKGLITEYYTQRLKCTEENAWDVLIDFLNENKLVHINYFRDKTPEEKSILSEVYKFGNSKYNRL